MYTQDFGGDCISRILMYVINITYVGVIIPQIQIALVEEGFGQKCKRMAGKADG